MFYLNKWIYSSPQFKGNFMKSILIALFSVVFIWGCSNNPDVVTLKSGLKYNDVKLGTGVEAKNGDLSRN